MLYGNSLPSNKVSLIMPTSFTQFAVLLSSFARISLMSAENFAMPSQITTLLSSSSSMHKPWLWNSSSESISELMCPLAMSFTNHSLFPLGSP